MIVLVRCDDRLIHGQCMTVIIHHYDVKRIIVVDDFTAGNSILRTVFQAAAPPGIDTKVYSVKDAAQPIREALDDDVRTLLLMKNPKTYPEIAAEVPDLPKEFNVGPMSNRKGTTAILSYINLLPDEAEAVRRIADSGVHVYFRQVPSQDTVEWDDVKNKL